jgi:hypothetical protein
MPIKTNRHELRPTMGGVVVAAAAAIALACGGGSDATTTPSASATRGQLLTPVTSAYSASGPLIIGNDEGAIAPEDIADESALPKVLPYFVLPIEGSPALLDGFGVPRGNRVHGGVDLGAAGGALVHAPCAGIVTDSGVSDSDGEHVTIDCGGGWVLLLAYLGSRSISTGASVAAGGAVGTVDSVLAFVHVEIRYNNRVVDPGPLLPLTGLPTPAATRAPTTPPPPVTPTAAETATPGATETAVVESSPTPSATPSATRTATATVPVPTATPQPPTATPRPATPTPTRTPPPIFR